jgi:HEAT repeat protein
MGLKRFIGLAALLACGLLLLVWLTLPLREPSYLGQPLSFWLSGNWVPRTPPELTLIRDQKDAALRQMGATAVPTLVRWLRAHDSPLKLKMLALIQKQPYIHLHRFSDTQQHRLASDGFVALGATAHSAIPAVLQIAQHGPDHDSRLHAAFALSYLGAPTEREVPALARAASCTNTPDAQRFAIRSLGRLQAQSALVVPTLLAALGASDTSVRTEALKALSQMPVEPRQSGRVVSAMITVLRDPSNSAGLPAAAACVILGKYGTRAAPAIPALFAFLKASPPDAGASRKFAVEAIGKIDPKAAASRAAELEAALRTPPIGSGR